MPSLLLVRHGQASFGSDDYDVLSELGREQAGLVHRELTRRGIEPAALVSGSMRRQRETGEPWRLAGASLEIDEGWNEYDTATVFATAGEEGVSLERPVGSGAAAAPETITPARFQRHLDGALATWIANGADPVGGEGWVEFRERVTAACAAALARLPRGGAGIVFTSGGPIAALSVEHLGLPDGAFVALNRVLVNGGVTKLIAGGSGVTVSSFNEHAHLEPGMVTYR